MFGVLRKGFVKMENGFIYKDKYKVLRRLGEGGSSKVFMAQDIETGVPVTIKRFKKHAHGTDSFSFPEEVEMLKSLDHPAIPKVIETFDDAVVLEYVPGNSLEKYIRHKKRLSEKEAVKISQELLKILEYLHGLDKPLIYRDLKPANIMIKPDGHVSLIDFGAARFYEKDVKGDTTNLGTSGFAAPEQYGNLGQSDPRTDIYCFGRTLLQMVSGVCSEELSAVADKCTRPDREDRFKSCAEIEKELLKYPRKRVMKRAFGYFKISVAAMAAAILVSAFAEYYDAARSYAYSDAEQRIPAVKERLGNVGLRIRGLLNETQEEPDDGIGEEISDGTVEKVSEDLMESGEEITIENTDLEEI